MESRSPSDRGATTSLDIIAERVDLAGRTIADVGCGALDFARELAERGASVVALDPDDAQAARNRAAEVVPNIAFHHCGAATIPMEDASADGVCFVFSLHHVPSALYPEVFREVRRVLRPEGFLCVIEPTDSPLYRVMKHFHDEDAVRAAAQDALDDLALPMFRRHDDLTYHSVIEFESFDDFAERYGGKTFNTGYCEADVRRPEVEADFERAGAPSYRFQSPKRMRWFEGLIAPGEGAAES